MAMAAWPATIFRKPTSSSINVRCVAGVDVDRPDDLSLRKQRRGQHRSEPGLTCQFGIAVLLLVVDIRNDHRLAFADHALDERAFHADRHAVHVIRRRTAGGADRQFLLLFVDQQDGAHRGIERLRHHFGNRLENAVQIAFRRDRLRDGRQRFQPPDRALSDCSARRARPITPPICSPINVTSATSSDEC